MKKYIKYAALAMISVFSLAACNDDDNKNNKGVVPVESVSATLGSFGATRAVNEANPTLSSLEARYEAGHTMTVLLNDLNNSGEYIPEGGKWVPKGDPVYFPGESSSAALTVTMFNENAVGQDGTAEGLLSYDMVSYTKSSQDKMRNIEGATLIHTRSLINLQFADNAGVEYVTGGVEVRAYNAPESKDYLFIVDPGVTKLFVGAQIFGRHYDREYEVSDFTSGSLSPNMIYNIPVSIDAEGFELQFDNITVSPWTDNPNPGYGQLGDGVQLFELKGYEGREITIHYSDGVTSTATLNDNAQFAIPSPSPAHVLYIEVANAPNIYIGVKRPDFIQLEFDADDKIVFRTNNAGDRMISTAAEFLALGAQAADMSGRTYITNDIDLLNQEFTPIPPVSGVFDGKHKNISNLTITGEAEYSAMFQSVTGTIRNVIIASGTVNCPNSTYSGGITGRVNAGGLVYACSNGADVTGGQYCGGIVGYCYVTDGVIVGNRNTGRIIGTENVGGVMGYIRAGYAEANYNTGEVGSRQASGYLGGAYARVSSSNITVNASYSTGELMDGYIPTGNNKGCFIGNTSGIQPTNSYWLSGPNWSAGGNNLTSSSVYEFSASNWPSDDAELGWGVVASGTPVGEDGYFWKSLGSYGSGEYPTLWWE